MNRFARFMIRLGPHGAHRAEVEEDIRNAVDSVARLRGSRAASRHAVALAARSTRDAWGLRLSGKVRDRMAGNRGARPAGDGLMTSLMRDAAIGLRLLGRSPGFAVASALMIAFGVGATTAIFSIVNAQLLTPLPYKDAHRIVFVQGWDLEANESRFNLAVPEYLDLRDADIFAEMSAYQYWSASLTGRGVPERLQGYLVTGSTFPMLGVQAALGRTLAPSDDGTSPAKVIVLSHQAWVAHFAADPAIVGRRVQLDGEAYDVVGVMPKVFEFPVFNFKGDFWAPYGMNEASVRAMRGRAGATTVLARLRDESSVESAAAAVAAVMERLRREHPDTNRNLGGAVIEMQELGLAEIRPALIAVMVAVALVLLLACANLANLLLARGVARRRELAVRAALGAGRGRLVRQLLTESLVLTLIGGALGALAAWWLLEALRAALPPFVQSVLPNVQELRVEWRALSVAFAASLFTGVAAGILPALRAAREAGGDALRVRDGGGHAGRYATGALVALQVALSVVLLCGASLLVRSFINVTRVAPGFDGTDVLTMSVTLPAARYRDPASQRQFYERALERIAALPGVQSTAAVNVLPFSTYNRGGMVTIQGADASSERAVRTNTRVETPAYLSTIGVPLIRGRGLTAADREGAPRVALINREFERRYFDGAAPLGATIRIGTAPEGDHTIVGVIGDVRHSSLTDGPEPEMHMAFAQRPAAFMMLAIRAPRPLEQVTAVRRAIAETDPLQPVFEVSTLGDLVARSIGPSRQVSRAMSVFAVAAVFLALVGLYALVAYAVKQRTREVGLRMALGATPGAVVKAMMRSALMLTAIGTAIGFAGSLAMSSAMKALLFGVPPVDALTFIAVPCVLMLSAAFACYLPARRAARVDPAIALRD